MTAPSLRALGTVTKASTTSPSFAAPAGAQASDVILVAFFQGDGRTSIGSAPAGFTLAPDLRQVNDPVFGDPAHSLYVYWGRYAAVGAGPYVFTVNSGTGGTPFVEGRAAAIQDCITSGSPWDAADGNTSGLTAVTTAPPVSATSTGPDRLAFYVATNWTGGAWTPPAGFTEQWDADDRIATFDTEILTTAQTVTPQAVCAGSNYSNAWVGILKPAAAILTQSVSGSITPAGAVTKRPARSVAGSTTPTGAARRTPGKVLAGAATATGSLVKQTARRLTGSTSPAGVVLKLLSRLLGGSTTPGGTVSTGSAGPTPEVDAFAGPPTVAWRAGPPETHWNVGPPQT